MSTLAYQSLTKRRDEAAPGTSDATSPGVGKYVDALAALVPAEVLALHALYLTFATETTTGADGAATTTITDPSALELGFWILVGAAAALFLFPKIRKLEAWDALRVFIPPLAFIAWTLLLTPSAFDPVNAALGLDWSIVTRQVIGVGAAPILGALAAGLAMTADTNTKFAPRMTSVIPAAPVVIPETHDVKP